MTTALGVYFVGDCDSLSCDDVLCTYDPTHGRTCALIRRTSYRMLVQEIVGQSHHWSDFVASSYNTRL